MIYVRKVGVVRSSDDKDPNTQKDNKTISDTRPWEVDLWNGRNYWGKILQGSRYLSGVPMDPQTYYFSRKKTRKKSYTIYIMLHPKSQPHWSNRG